MSGVDLIGYVASALIVVSLAMRSVVKLRTVSLIGSIVFTIYGALIGAWPVIISNSMIAIINVWYLRRELADTGEMAAVAIEPDAPFLVDYVRANGPEIAKSQPDYHPEPGDTFVRLLTRHGLPAGVLAGEPVGQELHVKLDYVTPRYQDSQVARWLFGQGRSVFTDAGFQRLVTQASTTEHHTYLEVAGFHQEGSRYVLDL